MFGYDGKPVEEDRQNKLIFAFETDVAGTCPCYAHNINQRLKDGFKMINSCEQEGEQSFKPSYFKGDLILF